MGNLHGAIRDIRRSILDERVSGNLHGEKLSLCLFSSVLEKSNRNVVAAMMAVAGGDGKRAAPLAEAAEDWIDVLAVARNGPPWITAAALRVLATLQDLVPDDRIAESVDILCGIAAPIWQTPAMIETPAAAAFDALAQLAFRVDGERATTLLDLAEPGLRASTSKTKEAALMAARLAVRMPQHRARIVEMFRNAVRLPYNDEIWSAVRKLPEVFSAIIDDIRSCAAQGDHDAIETLIEWNIATPETRRSAREYTYRLLCVPVGRATNHVGMGVFEQRAAQLVRALVRDGDRADEPLNLQALRGASGGDATDDQHRQFASIAQGDVDALAAAVASKLLDISADRFGTGQGRAQATRASVLLHDIMPPPWALGAAQHFLEVSAETERHPLDTLAFTIDPLAAMRWTTPPETLQGAAIGAASQLYCAALAAQPDLRDDRLVGQICEAAEQLLRSDNDRDCISAAWTLAELATSDVALVRLALHRLDDVRAMAMHVWCRSASRPSGIAVQLAADTSLKVRASVARRHAELASSPATAGLLADLATDRRHSVRMLVAALRS